MEEEWRPVKGFEGAYAVSNKGAVKSLSRYINNGKGQRLLPEKIKAQTTLNGTGYKQVRLWYGIKRQSCLVHRLVATAFLPAIEGKTFVNHIDGCKTNNNVENLEWVTNCENQMHSIKIGTSRHIGVENHKARSIIQQKNGECIKKWDYIKDAAASLGICQANIVACCNGRRKSAGGYTWRYATEEDS